jgi:D-sedoheptulose 7-phosphate isomerase
MGGGYATGMTPPTSPRSSASDPRHMQQTLDWIGGYKAAQSRALDSVPATAIAEIVELIREAGSAGRRIFVCGNGGNAANAAHFTTDLGKGASAVAARPFKVLSLADNVAWMTAIGNDYSFDELFVRQLENHAERGDLLILSSVSGSSPNLVAAARWGREHGLVTVALVGGKRGTVAEHADHLIVIDDLHYGRVEDVQMNILHMLCYAFMELKDG